jgi:hypothetical protein
MSTALDIRAAERLAKLCGMFGSEHDGERAAAALKANEFVRDLGLTWSDIVLKSTAIVVRNDDWRRMAEYGHKHRWRLDGRERRFVETMLDWQGQPSERQRQWLTDIYARLYCGVPK